MAEPATASEDFSRIPAAFGIPSTYWTVGSVLADTYRKAVENGTVAEDVPANHSPFFAPAIGPTLSASTRAPGSGGAGVSASSLT